MGSLSYGTYAMTAWADGMNADRSAGDFTKRSQAITNRDQLAIHLAPGGGWAAIIGRCIAELEPVRSKVKRRLNGQSNAIMILVAGFFSVQCGDQAVTIENPPVYLIPMAVGNQWHYRTELLDSLGNLVATTNETVRILDDTLVGGDLWFAFSSQGYRINMQEGVWQLLPTPFLEFPLNAGDSVLQGNGFTYVRLVSKGERVTVPAGTFVCFEYTETNPQENNALVSRFYLAPSLGLVKKELYSTTSASPTTIMQLLFYELR